MLKVTIAKYVYLPLLFFNHGIEFEDSLCNGCHDLAMLSVNVINKAITNVKNGDYICITD